MFALRMLTGVWSLSLMTTCVHEQKGPLANLEQSEKLGALYRSPSQQLSDLEKSLNQRDTRHLAPLVKDVKLMLTAMSYEQKSALADAGDYWQKAMNIAKGEFAKKAFEGWFQNYLKQVESPRDLKLLATLVLKETKQGQGSQYLTDSGFTSKESLIPYLKTLMEKQAPLHQANKQTQNTLLPPSKPGIPQEDPLLENLSDEYCDAGLPSSYQWNAWLRTLSTPAAKYWKGLSEKCAGEEQLAIRTFTESAQIAEKASSRADHIFAVLSYEHLVKLLRANDGRPEAASYYKALMAAWDLPGLSPSAMGLESHEFTLRRINDALWAARYRALIGDYQNAKIYVQDALELISKAHNQVEILTARLSEDLADYKAEAYHILAFRIAIEQHEYAHAAALTQAALQTPHLSSKWIANLHWYLGLYEYLDGRISQAIGAWETLLGKTEDKGVKAKALFWLSYLHNQKGSHAQSKEYLKTLEQEHPLSFYYVVAPKEAGLSKHKWQNLFPDPKSLERKLKTSASYDTSVLRREQPLSNELAKSELLLFAGLKAWALLPSESLYSSAIKLPKIPQDEEAFVYLTRMLYAVGNFKRAMNLTYELVIRNEQFWQEWPEQVHVYFPRAYAKHYQKQATSESVDISLLYGITRQESMFNAKALSSANAMGLMQIIKPTARRLASISGLEWSQTKDRLFEPKINIKLGSTYIKLLGIKYKKFLPAVIAAYNAGEYAVDMWIRRRVHPMKLLWAEMIPFAETRNYVKKVWKNYEIYRYLGSKRSMVTIFPSVLHKRRAEAEGKQNTMKH